MSDEARTDTDRLGPISQQQLQTAIDRAARAVRRGAPVRLGVAAQMLALPLG